MKSALNKSSGFIEVTIEGTGLSNSPQLFIDDFEQTLVSAAATKAVFNLVNLIDQTTTNIKFYTEEGLPVGANLLSSHTFTPAFLGVSPKTGCSSGGCSVTITGAGFGSKPTAVFNLLMAKNNNLLCDTVEHTSYGTYTCNTKAQEIIDGDVLKMYIGTS
jgi:hypothetical protein